MEKPSGGVEYTTAYRWSFIIISFFFFILAFRFFQVQFIKGEKYEKLARVSHIGKERLPPRRGLIKARNEEVIAKNIDTHNLYVIPHFMKNPEEEIKKICGLLNLVDEECNEMLEKVKKNLKGSDRFNKVILRKNLVSGHCPYDTTPLIFEVKSQTLFCPSCKKRYYDEKAILLSHLHELAGVYVETSLQRFYPMGKLTAHVSGFINEVNKKDIENEKSYYKIGDEIGRSGSEKAFEKILRGKYGEKLFVRDASGLKIPHSQLPPPLKNLKGTKPVNGNNITLTIDLDLQNIAEEVLKPYPSGAIVVVKINTGEILTLYSKPSFDPNKWAGRLLKKDKEEYDKNIYSPMLNKALVSYPPGSTFKLIPAFAGLKDGIINEDTEFKCEGFYEFKGRKFRCYHRGGHGKIDLVNAIKVSCDIYFYRVGELLGMRRIAEYSHIFGLGEKTGIELSESIGRIPTVEWHMKHSPKGFQPGFVLNTSVGQGDVKVTPLQLARMFSSILNGGKLFKLHLLLKVEDENGNIIKELKPEVERVIDVDEKTAKLLKEGMILSVNNKEGTGYQARIEELPFGGKTGTAEAPYVKKNVSDDIKAWFLMDHAWFVGFAPAHNPEIVVVVFIEHGGMGGKVAAPLAREIIKRYYAGHLEDIEFYDNFSFNPIE